MLNRFTLLCFVLIFLLIPQFALAMPQHLNPTYLTFEGELHKWDSNGYVYSTGEKYNATFYMDYNRDAVTYYSPNGSPEARNCYARYVSGNIFGVLSDIEGVASDYYGLWYDMPGWEPGRGEGYFYFDLPFGEFFNYSKNASALWIGDYLDYYIYRDGKIYGNIVMTCTSFTETAYPEPIPEPATCLFVGAGLAGAALLRKRIKA